jgi:hypothetical protein
MTVSTENDRPIEHEKKIEKGIYIYITCWSTSLVMAFVAECAVCVSLSVPCVCR